MENDACGFYRVMVPDACDGDDAFFDFLLQIDPTVTAEDVETAKTEGHTFGTLCCSTCEKAAVNDGSQCEDLDSDLLMSYMRVMEEHGGQGQGGGGDQQDHNDQDEGDRRRSLEKSRRLEPDGSMMYPFDDCASLADLGFCDEELFGMVVAFGGFSTATCCKSCSKVNKDECRDNNKLLAVMPESEGAKCKELADAYTGDICEDDMMKKLCCRHCNPPAKVVVIAVPATMGIDIPEVPEEGSDELKILAAGIKNAVRLSS
jgi:hypothetical protein